MLSAAPSSFATAGLVIGVLGAHLALAYWLWQAPVMASTAAPAQAMAVQWLPPVPATQTPAKPLTGSVRERMHVRPKPGPARAPGPSQTGPVRADAQAPAVATPPTDDVTSTEGIEATHPEVPQERDGGPDAAVPSGELRAVQYLTPPQPQYPERARRLGEAGTVLIRVWVTAAGLPQHINVRQGSGFARLDEAAVRAVQATRFKPYFENGRPTAGWAEIPLVFDLEMP